MSVPHCRAGGCSNRVAAEGLTFCGGCWRLIPTPIQRDVSRFAARLQDAVQRANRAIAESRAA
jgi:hypothetical protein